MSNHTPFNPARPFPRRQALVFVAVGLAGFLLPRTGRAQVSAATPGRVGFLRGEVTTESAGGRRTLKLGDGVSVGDVIATGRYGRLLLQFGERTTLRLGAAARVRIVSYAAGVGGEFELLSGAVQLERTGRPFTGEIRLRSPHGLIAGRSGRIFAGPSRGAFGVFVSTGLATVTAGGRTVTLRPRQGTDIAAPGAPPTEPRGWGARRLRAALRGVG